MRALISCLTRAAALSAFLRALEAARQGSHNGLRYVDRVAAWVAPQATADGRASAVGI